LRKKNRKEKSNVKPSAGTEFMRVYFAPNGIGLGHAGRSIPIAKRLLHRNAKVMFSTYLDGIRYVENERFPLVKAPPIGLRVKPDGSIDFRQTAIDPGPFLAVYTLLQQVNAELEFIQSFDPDIVVSDSRVSALLAARLLGIPRICILNQFQVMVPRREHHLTLARFADYMGLALIGRMWTSSNIVLIPDFPQPYTISIGNLSIPKSYQKSVKLIGPILDVHPNELGTKDELRRSLGLDVDRPFIFVPISGPIREKAFIAGLLRKILLDFPKDYEVVMSLGYPGVADRHKRYGNVTIYDWIPNRFEYLKACDVIIARAGHGTITQAMCYGKPMIIVPTPGQTEQINNAKQARDLGAANILLQKNLTKSTLLNVIEQTLKGSYHKRLEIIQEETLKYDGLQNAVTAINDMARR
jgi:UDP-N-acetylglucosamine--N-acetylmuramyl-(pentapeptide) pyrophosphoryl-undecaprenol N-acetylglucosamine transferase